MSTIEEVWRNRQLEVDNCDSCPGCNAPYPLAFGNTDADVMLVGMEPAYNLDERVANIEMDWEDVKDKLLVERKACENPLWQHMENVALAANTVPGNLYFTNVAKCGGTSDDFDERVNHCSGYLKQELITVDPQVLLLHGGNVLDVAADILGIEELSGSVGSVHGEWFQKYSMNILPLYHWGYAYRRGNVTEYNKLVAKRVSEIV